MLKNRNASAPAAGRVVRKGSTGAVLRGNDQRVQKYGGEVKGTAGSGDPAAPTFRKLNNVDAKPRNV